MDGCNVWLKMENVQNASSFKVRGIGLHCQRLAQQKCKYFISFSGGNAGLAAAYSAKKLSIPITVVVPENTQDFMVVKIATEADFVTVRGKNVDEAKKYAEKLKEEIPDSEIIPPFDHKDIWEGHSTLITEVKEQMRGVKPDLVVLSVGGGGLMCGVLQGMHAVRWNDVPLLARETCGAHSLNACVIEGKWTELERVTRNIGAFFSIARTLAVKKGAEKAFEWLSDHNVISHVVDDKEAVSACIRIADDHRVLVPPACGAALAAVFSGVIKDLKKEGTLPKKLSNIMIVVCGGNEVNLKEIENEFGVHENQRTLTNVFRMDPYWTQCA